MDEGGRREKDDWDRKPGGFSVLLLKIAVRIYSVTAEL